MKRASEAEDAEVSAPLVAGVPGRVNTPPGPRRGGPSRREIASGREVLRSSRIAVLLVGAVVGPLVVHFFGGSYWDYVFIIGTIESLAVLSSNLVVGYLGELNLATGAFMAVGAYSVEIFGTHMGFLWATTLSVLVCGILGLAVALPASRLRGAQAALATFALAWALPDLINAAKSLTGGPLGKYVLITPTFFIKFASGSLAMSYLVSGLFVACALGCLFAIYGRWGRLAVAAAESKPAAESFGVKTVRLKIGVWVLASLIAGLAGALYAPATGYLSSSEFTFQLSLFIFVGSIIGGARSIPGAWVGGLVVGMVPQIISSSVGGEDILVFGSLLLGMVLVARSGVYPEIEVACTRAAAFVRSSRFRSRARRVGNELGS